MTPNGILAICSENELRRLSLRDFIGRTMTEEETRHIFELCDAFWLHDGGNSRPHVELTTGKCSDGFVDVLRVIRYTNLCEIFAAELLKVVRRRYEGPIDWVVGSDHASAALSHSVATIVGCQHDFTEKGPDKMQIWKRFTIQPHEIVLQVEELMTTSATLRKVREGIQSGNPTAVRFAPVVAVLIHRSSVYEVNESPAVYLAHYDINIWEPEDCPLCKAGSERLRPKQNWAKLTRAIE